MTDKKSVAENRLLTAIAKEFPELKWNKYQYIDEGWDHEIIILDDILVFRFPTDDEYTKKLSHEIKVLKHLANTVSVRIPKYEYIAEHSDFGGYKLIEGQQLSKSRFDDLQINQKLMIAQQLAEFLTTIHGQDIQKEPFASVSPSYLPADQTYTKTVAREQLKVVLNKEEYAIVQEILTDIDDLISQNLTLAFTHNDIYNRHLLWDKSAQKLGIIDFSDMCLGDPAIDFAELHEYGVSFVNEVYKFYNGPKDDAFLDRAWKYQRWAGVYMMVDHFESQKTSFEVAKETFNNVENGSLLQQ